METYKEQSRRQTRKDRERKRRLRQKRIHRVVIAVLLLAGVVLVGVLFTFSQQNPKQQDLPAVVKDRLSRQTLNLSQSSTWQPNPNNLPKLITALNLPPSDPANLHHHTHLDIFIDGQKIAVPAQIGLSSQAEAPLHTHDLSGIIHIETADTRFEPTLGLLFDIWGVVFSSDGIGGYANSGSQQLTVYVNGKRYEADPRELPLNQHDEIVVVFGSESQQPSPVPSSYEFPNGE